MANMKCTCGRELSEAELNDRCLGCGESGHRWSDKLQAMEPYPYLSIPWDQEGDGAAAFDKMPDRLMHF